MVPWMRQDSIGRRTAALIPILAAALLLLGFGFVAKLVAGGESTAFDPFQEPTQAEKCSPLSRRKSPRRYRRHRRHHFERRIRSTPPATEKNDLVIVTL
jgi:hypothetical protein